MEQIIAEEDDEDRGYITAKDFMNDFATEEFLNKNIRVRPQSGVSKGGADDGKTEGMQRSLQDPFGNQGDEDEKFNAMKIIEMQDERQEIKRNKEEYEKRKKAEEEKLLKKKR